MVSITIGKEGRAADRPRNGLGSCDDSNDESIVVILLGGGSLGIILLVAFVELRDFTLFDKSFGNILNHAEDFRLRNQLQ